MTGGEGSGASADIAAAQPARRLSAWQLACYGLLTMPIAMAGLVLLTYLPTFYALDLGLGLGVVGAVFVAGRVFDIVTDPLVGHLSDRTRSRVGPRKPWMAVGVAGFTVAVWFLMVPPSDAGPLYLVMIGVVFFLFLTMLDIPYSSVGLELSPHVHERSALAGSKAAFQVAGAMLAGFLPLLLATSAALALPTIAAVTIGLALAGFALFIAFVPDRRPATPQPRLGLLRALKAAAGERRYALLIGAFFIVQLANAFFSGLAVLYITFVVKAPELVGLFIGLMFVATALFLPLWLLLAKRIGKVACWRAGIMVSIVALLGALAVGEGDIAAACLVFAVVGSTFGCDAVMPTSLLADIVDDRDRNGKGRLSGVFLALKNALSKLSFVAPMGIAFPVLGYLQFETAAAHSVTTLAVFLGFFAVAPVVLKLAGIAILSRAGEAIGMRSAHA